MNKQCIFSRYSVCCGLPWHFCNPTPISLNQSPGEPSFRITSQFFYRRHSGSIWKIESPSSDSSFNLHIHHWGPTFDSSSTSPSHAYYERHNRTICHGGEGGITNSSPPLSERLSAPNKIPFQMVLPPVRKSIYVTLCTCVIYTAQMISNIFDHRMSTGRHLSNILVKIAFEER